MKPPAAGMGRPKGALNKTTRTVKEAITLAAEELGGVPRLVAWAKESPENESAFWQRIYTKLVPLDVHGSHEIAVAAPDVVELRSQAQAEIEDLFGRGSMGPLIERK